MRIREFTYRKATGEESKRRVLALQENPSFVEGVDLTQLTPAEEEVVLNAFKDFTEKLNPYISKAYRKFNVSSIIG